MLNTNIYTYYSFGSIHSDELYIELVLLVYYTSTVLVTRFQRHLRGHPSPAHGHLAEPLDPAVLSESHAAPPPPLRARYIM